MKKIISIAAIIFYIFSTNTLVHASTMGFFSHTNNGIETWHCTTHTQSTQNKNPNISCCEFALSSEYSNTQIQWEYIDDLPHIIPNFDFLIKDHYLPLIYTEDVVWSPWRNPDIKYQKFSDLFGSIVSLT